MRFLALLILIAGICGYWYYTHNQSEVQDAVREATATKNAGIDSAVEAALQGVAKAAPLYYWKNRNYGVSLKQSICNDESSDNSIGVLVAGIHGITKSVTCTVDTDFPARSFTIVAPSKAHEGEYFCADQGGYVGLIPDIEGSGTFRLGIKCK